MIIDTLENADKYTSLHPLFSKALDYITSTDLESVEDGKYEISEGLKSIVATKIGMTAQESEAKFECHNNNIDIQICIKGNETFGWRSRNNCTKQKGEYNLEKDVLFFNDEPSMHFTLTAGEFVIFYPEDVHAPMIGEDEIKKMVIKVKK